MKLKFECLECLHEKGYVDNEDYSYVDITESSIYKYKCRLGHEFTIIIEHHKFEILFEMGVLALLDGYTREAVANFAAALERYYEFSIEVLLRDRNILRSDYNNVWKIIKNQSERQIGAYVVLYTSAFKKPPILINDSLTKFRNDVIHKGVFPEYDDVIKYATAVFTYIKEHLIELKECYADALEIVYRKNLNDYFLDSKEDVHCISWSEYTIFRSNRPIEEIRNLEFQKCMEDRRTIKTFLSNNYSETKQDSNVKEG